MQKQDDVSSNQDKSVSILEFCDQQGISRALFYKLQARGKMPRTVKLGSRVVIFPEAVAEWKSRLMAEPSDNH